MVPAGLKPDSAAWWHRCRSGTNRTSPLDLDDPAADAETEGRGIAGQPGLDLGIFQLSGCPASDTDEEDADMVMLGMRARHEGITAFQLGHQALRNQKLEGAIHGRRTDRPAGGAFPVLDELVSAHRLVAPP